MVGVASLAAAQGTAGAARDSCGGRGEVRDKRLDRTISHDLARSRTISHDLASPHMISHDHARSSAISVLGARPRSSARRATTAPSTTSTPRRCARWSARSWASRASYWWCRTTGASGAAGWTCRPRCLRTAPPSASLDRRKAPASLLRPFQSFESVPLSTVRWRIEPAKGARAKTLTGPAGVVTAGRLGAFEVEAFFLIRGVLSSHMLHSKLGSCRWPNTTRLAASIRSLPNVFPRAYAARGPRTQPS